MLNNDEFNGKYSCSFKLRDGNYTVNTLTKENAPKVYFYAHTNMEEIYGLEGKWGLVDKFDNVIIEPKYIYPLLNYGDNLQAMLPEDIIDGVVTTLKHGLINKKGNTIIPFKYIYMECMDISGTYFRVVEPEIDKAGVIDKNNEIVVPFEYDFISADLEICDSDNIYQVVVVNNYLQGVYDLILKKEIIKPKYGHIEIVDYNKFLIGDDYETCNIMINEKEEIIYKKVDI